MGKFRSREHPTKVIDLVKTTLTKFPINARAVLTKMCFEEHRAIAGRLFSIRFYRKHVSTLQDQYALVSKAYFRDDWQDIVAKL